ncbi:hypothetical protein DDB_G0282201 [Dictyostelium discoideum AX4]|uniref:Right handed beta helix domain-containing protein n=1 Tax=Dictyostelium discoideum TaxID=44689 RepID=Q54SV2_DICDI|nr:hypothetical protein DDB_G0282201 [Dictyostelium discoideum AX4]EAL66306.1 hypothetical protein DDB_G0282201 [Dictyostelium discoideum AX4]|eukprot:XP_640283.1 hypothetical protein DDB_G0282201 [Dictyostelium discoideum AX4]
MKVNIISFSLIFLILFITISFNYCQSNNQIDLYISNSKGKDENGCGLLGNEHQCKSIDYAINQIKDKYKSINSYSKIKVHITPGEYKNIQQDLSDLNISFENTLFQELPILKLIDPNEEDNEEIDIDDDNDDDNDENNNNNNNNNNNENDKDNINPFDESYIEYEILEEEVEQLAKQQNPNEQVIFKNDGSEKPMFYLSNKSKNEITFKGISFKDSNSMNYILNFDNSGSGNSGNSGGGGGSIGGLNLNIINCNFENDFNQFLNVKEISNQRVQIIIKNSRFIGTHQNSIPLDESSIKIESKQSSTHIEIENSIIKNIRGSNNSPWISLNLESKSNNGDIPMNANGIFNKLLIKQTLFKDNIGSGSLLVSGFQIVEIFNSLFDSNEKYGITTTINNQNNNQNNNNHHQNINYNNNNGGGAISIINSGKILIDSSSFYKNYGRGLGGALFLNNIKQRITIIDSIFYENYAYNGGSIYVSNCNDRCSLELQSNRIVNNVATLFGSSIYCSYSNVDFQDSNNKFENNIITAKNEFELASSSFRKFNFKRQIYHGFDCLVDLDQGGSTCNFKGTNETMVNEILMNPNCSGKSLSAFLLEHFELILILLFLIFITIIFILFLKISQKRQNNFKNFLINNDDNNNNNNINYNNNNYNNNNNNNNEEIIENKIKNRKNKIK